MELLGLCGNSVLDIYIYIYSCIYICVCVCVCVCVFSPHCQACRIFVPQPGIELGPLAVEVWSPNHRTTREFPGFIFLKLILAAVLRIDCMGTRAEVGSSVRRLLLQAFLEVRGPGIVSFPLEMRTVVLNAQGHPSLN